MPLPMFGVDPGWVGGLAKGIVEQVPKQSFLTRAFSNPMFLQLLAAGGADLMQQTGGKNTLEALTKNIAGGSFKTIMQSLLGSKSPDAKVTIGGDGTFTFKAPGQTEGAGGGTSTPASAPAAAPTASTGSNANPLGNLAGLFQSMLDRQSSFSSGLSGLSASDLAGLGPEEIAQALTIGQRENQLRSQSVKDIADAMYNAGMLSVAERNAAVSEAELPIKRTQAETDRITAETGRLNSLQRMFESLQTAPIELPGVGEVSLEEWSKLPDDVRAFAYAAFLDPSIKDYDTWKMRSKPGDTERMIERSMRDPEFKKALLEYRKSGATSIHLTPGEQEISKANVSGEVYFKKDFSEDLNKHIKDFETYMVEDPETPEYSRALISEKARWIESAIASRGGTVVGQPRMEGRTRVWTVRWEPSGRTSEVRYGF